MLPRLFLVYEFVIEKASGIFCYEGGGLDKAVVGFYSFRFSTSFYMDEKNMREDIL